MRPLRLSVRARLTAWYGGFFLLAGVVLVALNYVLVSAQLPQVDSFAIAVAGPPPAPVDQMQVVTTLEDYRSETLNTLLLQSGVGLVVTTALAGIVGWVLASRVLEPLQSITATAHRLEVEDLGRRINLDGPDDELKELADTFDGMLDRLATAFDSQKRFVANASHELRTPLAIQRTLIEVALADEHASADVKRLGGHLLATNVRSERLIDGLLLLARSDRGLGRREPVELDQLVEDVVYTFRHEPQDISLEAEPVTVLGDPVLLAHLVTNLLRNACTHNHEDGHVAVVVRGTNPLLVVANTGEVIPEEAVPGLFEPFRRLPGAGGGGAGLGLSIVRSIALAHQGNVSAYPAGGGGLCVEVNLPVTDVRTTATYGKIT
ncbi:HAMP domain-containing sensor histidine kinase [Saccharothrix sp.]|uniref:sensor histidine kinase n=1 Tax=Saccharothrix sp. TaxID=1873460 RepID=UPI002810F52C|nr:HAMP domain-containing sensor histidine kinase [Saccharothrix sp.]